MSSTLTVLSVLMILSGAYWATRVVNLTLLPIFNDEANYLHWATLMNRDSSNLWISLKVDNVKPLSLWLIALIVKLFNDPLVAGRSVSVLAGFFSLIGIYLITSRVHSQRAALAGTLFYLVSPYHLFFDRLVHKASLLNCFFVWVIWFTVQMFYGEKKITEKYYLPMGVVLGLSLLTESTAVLFVFIPLLCKLCFFKDTNLPTWKPLIIASMVGVVIGGFPYLYLYSTDNSFHVNNIFIPSGNGLSQLGVTTLLMGMPAKVIRVASGVMGYFWVYLTWPVLLLAVGGFIQQVKHKSRFVIVLSAYFILPMIALMGTAGTGFTRYYLFCSTPLLIWAALGLAEFVGLLNLFFARPITYFSGVVLFLILLPAATFDYKILTHPESAPLVDSDRSQYVTSEFSGYGIPEAVNYFKALAKEKKISLFVSSNWGTPEDAMSIYLDGYPNINVYMAHWVFKQPLLPPDKIELNILQNYTGRLLKTVSVSELGEVYFICKGAAFNRQGFLSRNPNLRLVNAFGKPGGLYYYDVYKMEPAGD